MRPSDLVKLSMAEAQRAKWQAGRDKYGEAWAGEAPILEALSDAVDVCNYLDEAIRREPRASFLWVLREDARSLAERIQLACASVPL